MEEESLKTKKTEQVTAGINAGFIEIVKIYNYLPSAPLLFAVFTNPKRGPAVAQAVLKIVQYCNNSSEWMSYQLNEGWEEYNVDNDTDKAMMDLLVNNKNDVCHFFDDLVSVVLVLKITLKNDIIQLQRH